MRFLICGGRDFDDHDLFEVSMSKLTKVHGFPEMVIHGAAKGADQMASEWADDLCIPELRCRANWLVWGKKFAGPRRNRLMLELGQPDFVIAFPGGSGTADMVKQARAYRLKGSLLGPRVILIK